MTTDIIVAASLEAVRNEGFVVQAEISPSHITVFVAAPSRIARADSKKFQVFQDVIRRLRNRISVPVYVIFGDSERQELAEIQLYSALHTILGERLKSVALSPVNQDSCLVLLELHPSN